MLLLSFKVELKPQQTYCLSDKNSFRYRVFLCLNSLALSHFSLLFTRFPTIHNYSTRQSSMLPLPEFNSNLEIKTSMERNFLIRYPPT